VVEVLSPAGGPETIILTETGTGATWILQGDVASELRESWGRTVTVSGIRTGPARSAPPGWPALEVVDYEFEGEPEEGSEEP
jgi:hypothetical protein